MSLEAPRAQTGINPVVQSIYYGESSHQPNPFMPTQSQQIENFLAPLVQLTSYYWNSAREFGAYLRSKMLFPSASAIVIKNPTFIESTEESNDLSGCILPTGNYVEKCKGIIITQTGSKCNLKADCSDGAKRTYRNEVEFLEGQELILTVKDGILKQNFDFIDSDQVFFIDEGNHPCAAGLHAIDSKVHCDEKTLNLFHQLSSDTGGITSICPKRFLKLALEGVFSHISKGLDPEKPAEIALVLDATSSMAPEIKTVKNNLIRFVREFQNHKKMSFAIVLFRDVGDNFVTKINTPFTKNIESVVENLKLVDADGGGDTPEAGLDALLTTLDLPWESRQCNLVLVGDSSFHQKSQRGHSTENVIELFKKSEIKISVYPVKTY